MLTQNGKEEAAKTKEKMIKIFKIGEEGEFVGFENNEVTAIPAFKAMLALNYNKQKGDIDGRKRFRAKSEFFYMYLMYDPRSPYVNYTEQERHEESLRDAGLDSDWKPSEEFNKVKEKYLLCVESRFYKVLKSAEKALDQIRVFLDSVDLSDPSKSTTKPKDIIDIIADLPKVSASLSQLQEQAKLSLSPVSQSKGDHELGFLATRKLKGDGRTTSGEDSQEDNTED